jgi:hypothetical protein
MFRRLQLNPSDLVWQQLVSPPAPQHVAEAVASYGAAADGPAKGKGASFADAIAEAKQRLAVSLGIAAEKIEITIRL